MMNSFKLGNIKSFSTLQYTATIGGSN